MKVHCKLYSQSIIEGGVIDNYNPYFYESMIIHPPSKFYAGSVFTPQPLRLRGIVVPRAGGRAGGRADGRAGGRQGGRQGRQAPLTLSRP